MTLILILLLAMILILLLMVWIRILLEVLMRLVVLGIVPPTAIHVVWRALMMMILLLLLPDSLVLHLEALVANLIAVHLLNGTLGGVRRVIGDKAKSLGLASMPIDINFGRYDIPKWSKGRNEIWIGQIVRQMIDE